ncbi:hypothetical protein ABG067_003023 [Albugo candida]
MEAFDCEKTKLGLSSEKIVRDAAALTAAVFHQYDTRYLKTKDTMDDEQIKMYVPHEADGWIKASVSKCHWTHQETIHAVVEGDDEEHMEHKSAPGTSCTVLKSSLLVRNERNVDGCDDMAKLNHLHEAAILYNLRQRFLQRAPYTYSGPICIAMNPYAWLHLYSKKLQNLYYVRDRDELPPHIYAISARSYRDMRSSTKDQSIFVSGESGAGKTETTKILMSHLATAGFDVPKFGIKEIASNFIQQVLQSNPLMESFGNAKTSRNDNSSRFGKFTELQFSASGHLMGAHSSTYLLEKSRVSFQRPGEQNYHIFYQLLASSSPIKMQVQLDDVNFGDFPILPFDESSNGLISKDLELSPGSHELGGIRQEGESPRESNCRLTYQKSFDSILDCLTVLGIPSQIQVEVFKVVSAIMYLSCLKPIRYGEDIDESILDPNDPISVRGSTRACQLIQVEESDLMTALTAREIHLPVVSETYKVPLTVQQASNARNALATTLYSYLFQWLANRVNTTTACKDNKSVVNRICILDIFGFENLKQNSYEQFCINYANEKLQRKFTEDVLDFTQSEYKEEGLTWPNVAFEDNLDILTLIEGRSGILSLLNEEGFRPKGSDRSFTDTLRAHFNDHGCFKYPRFRNDAFSIKHYAGFVLYETDGFLMKNTGASVDDIMQLIRQSRSYFLRSMFSLELSTNQASSLARKNPSAPGSRRSNTTFQKSMSIVRGTVGSQFKDQLNGLSARIRQTNVHYIRCIKPNNCKSPSVFDKKHALEQLRCSGVLDAAQISRNVFPVQMLQKCFIKRFSDVTLLEPAKPYLQAGDVSCAATVHSRRFGHADRYRCSVDLSDQFDRNTTIDLLHHLLPFDTNTYQVGKNRVYFCKGVLEALEGLRARELNSKARLIQTFIKMWVARIKYFKVRQAVIRLQTWYRSCFVRRHYRRQRAAAIKVQSHVRCYMAIKILNHLQKQAKGDAKVRNQIDLFKVQLASKIDRLLWENATTKAASSTVKDVSFREQEGIENIKRREKTSGTSLVVANRRRMQLNEEIEMLNTAHTRIKTTPLTNSAARHFQLMQSLIEMVVERKALARELHDATLSAKRLQQEIASLFKTDFSFQPLQRQNHEMNYSERWKITKNAQVRALEISMESNESSSSPVTQPAHLQRQNSVTSTATSTQVSSPISEASHRTCGTTSWPKTSPSLDLVHIKHSLSFPDNLPDSESLPISRSQQDLMTQEARRCSIFNSNEFFHHDARSDLQNSIMSKLALITQHVINNACVLSTGDDTESEEVSVHESHSF